MKSIINISLLAFLCVGVCIAQENNSNEVKDYLKRTNFQLTLCELSFCAKEIMSTLENDSTSRKMFKASLKYSFDARLDKYDLFINQNQAQMLFDSLTVLQNKKLFPKAYLFILSLKQTIPIKSYEFKDYVKPFIERIKYPDQIDDICNFYLVYYKEEKPFDEILKDEDALYCFNQWLKYGFIEFRGYSLKITPQNEISNRIIRRIRINHPNPKNNLLKKTLSMLNNLENN